jgi:glycosyltransferase involved in cell wall biosynthesis
MRVLIDATYIRRGPRSGTGIYVERLVEALDRLDEVEVETVVNTRRRPPAGGGIGSVRNLLADGWWASIQLARLARRAGAEVIHHPLPAFSRWSGIPQVVTVHDLAFEVLPQHFDRGYRRYAQIAHRSAARASDAVVCVSAATAAEVRRRWDVAEERIVVAPLGPGQEVALRTGERRHFLYVGDDQPRKNLRVLIAAYAGYRQRTEQPIELVLAGTASYRGDGVRIEASPSQERLAELYGGAVALIHPSLHEGFGLTALEAMSLGVPVIASSIPALREICGPAALYAEPHDARAFATAMLQLARQPRLREHLSEQGRRQAARFSWTRCARAHLDAYRLARASYAGGPYPVAQKRR